MQPLVSNRTQFGKQSRIECNTCSLPDHVRIPIACQIMNLLSTLIVKVMGTCSLKEEAV